MKQSVFKSRLLGNVLTCPMAVCKKLGKAGVNVISESDEGEKWIIVTQCRECKRKWEITVSMKEH